MSNINPIVKKLRENRILNEREDYKNKSREELIDLAQGGDQLALDTLIRSHEDLIRKVSSRYFGDNSYDREDILQLSTMAFWKAVMSWDKSGDFDAYAGMTIKRDLITELGKLSAEKRQSNANSTYLSSTVSDDGEGGESTLGDTLVSKSGSAEDEFMSKDSIDNITRAMETLLSEQERKALRLYIEGYKIAQIAEEIDMKYKSVENAVRRAKEKLREYLTESKREGKKLKESSDLEFTEEEKHLLTIALDKIDNKKRFREARQVNPDYASYTRDQFAEELDTIESIVGDIVYELRDLYDEEERQPYYNDLDDLYNRVNDLEEYLDDAQYDEAEDLLMKISIAKDTEYAGDEAPKRDRYAEVGMSPSDF